MAEIAKPTQRYRAQDLERLADSDQRYELVAALLPFIRTHGLGQLMAEAGFLLESEPDTVRAPDVAFISRERIAPISGGYYPFAPDLAVEVISPSNSVGAVQAKIAQYFAKGARQVWLIYPAMRTLHVYSSPKSVRILDATDTLEGGDMLPNFSLPVAELFAQL
ncbi:MAG: Uma2 family endonuclease [Chloroflexi bacterium CFX4]|nr:Uma2 family endonuclease [Chloroflexi bacterium CFX4]